MAFDFKVKATCGRARRGELTLNHGVVQTPIFMPVGTYGSVKAMAPYELKEIGSQIILGNTFHLWLRPGLEVIGAHNGLHDFMQWDKPILTDSGGFQVFSLGELRKITEEGVKFSNPINGDKLFLSPEVSMKIQRVLNSDVVMVLDECTPYKIGDRPATELEAAKSMRMSLRWAKRSAASRAACSSTFVRSRSRASRTSASTAMPWAAFPSASPRRTCSASWTTSCTSSPTTVRAT